MLLSEIIDKLQLLGQILDGREEFGNVHVDALNVRDDIEIKIKDHGTFIFE